jgi:hypothetical protein
MLGFVVYLVFAFMLGFIFMSGAVLWSMFLVLFAYVTHAVRRGVGRPGETTVGFSVDLRNKLGLIFAVALVLVGFVFWIMVGLSAFGFFAVFLQSCAVALAIWVLFAGSEKSVGLVRFVVKVFVVSFVLTFFLWFVDAWFSVSWVLSWVLLFFGRGFVFSVVPLSLLPVALSVTAYGLFRKPLSAWIILLSSWYVSIYGVFAAYDVWWLVFIYPYLTGPPYFGGGGLIARDMLLVFLAFVVACVFTAVYVWRRKPKQSPPP